MMNCRSTVYKYRTWNNRTTPTLLSEVVVFGVFIDRYHDYSNYFNGASVMVICGMEMSVCTICASIY